MRSVCQACSALRKPANERLFLMHHALHQHFDLAGTFLNAWGINGSGDGQFIGPQESTVFQGAVHVVDQGNHRIQKFSLSPSTAVERQGWGSVKGLYLE